MLQGAGFGKGVKRWDIVITSICVLNDPYPIAPSLLVFIMVVLGNGMRYGMRLFAESLIGCFTATMLVLSARYLIDGASLSPGLIFLNLFGGIFTMGDTSGANQGSFGWQAGAELCQNVVRHFLYRRAAQTALLVCIPHA